MLVAVEELVSTYLDELLIGQRFVPYVLHTEAAGFSQLVKLFRVLAASETVRDALLR